jgi:hypothetical protein
MRSRDLEVAKGRSREHSRQGQNAPADSARLSMNSLIVIVQSRGRHSIGTRLMLAMTEGIAMRRVVIRSLFPSCKLQVSVVSLSFHLIVGNLYFEGGGGDACTAYDERVMARADPGIEREVDRLSAA